eukprot:scaffold65633_cov33-Phaeocystis_antarctica.AAC.1
MTEPISLTRYLCPPSLFGPARATFCGERPDDHRLACCVDVSARVWCGSAVSAQKDISEFVTKICSHPL